jgi:hypothetical protein
LLITSPVWPSSRISIGMPDAIGELVRWQAWFYPFKPIPANMKSQGVLQCNIQ